MRQYHEYVRNARKAGHTYSAIARQMMRKRYPLSLMLRIFLTYDLKRRLEIGSIAAVFVLMAVGLYFNSSSITGRTILENRTYLSHEVNLSLDENGIYTFVPQVDGELLSLAISGRLFGNGTAKVYLVTQDNIYLVYSSESQGLAAATAHIAADTEIITDDLSDEFVSEGVEPSPEPEEPQEETVDVPAAPSEQDDADVSLTVNDTVLVPGPDNSTPEEVFIEDTYLDLNEEPINASDVLLDNATQLTENTTEIPAEVDQDTSGDLEGAIIDSECEETCLLHSISDEQYTLRVEINDAVLHLESIEYSILPLDAQTADANTTVLDYLANATNESVVNQTPSSPGAMMLTKVIVEQPVLWEQVIDLGMVESVTLPKEAFNISADAQAEVSYAEATLSVQEYNEVKKYDITSKKFDSYSSDSEGSLSEAISLGIMANELKSKIKADPPAGDITLKFKEKDKLIKLIYLTEGPTITEQALSGSRKLVTVSSDLHYTDILAYTDLEIQAPKANIDIVWLTGDGRIPIPAAYLDTDSDGLIDRLEWTVPSLSNQTYEISITVLDVQSYPVVGGYWTVGFTTTGQADLIISGEDGTDYGIDIVHDSLTCGGEVLDVIQQDNAVMVPNYSCDTTAYHKVQVLTTGVHTRRFDFGGEVAYAYNDASQLPKTMNIQGKLTNSTDSSLINESVTMVFRIYSSFTGGSPLWSETQTVDVSEGIYDTILGKTTPLNLAFNQSYYMSIEVNSDGEMSPRINLTNSPYTFTAETALNLTCTDCIGGSQIDESTLVGVNAALLDSLDSSAFCQSDGTNCPEGATATSPWTNNTYDIYPRAGFPGHVNITANLTLNNAIYYDTDDPRIILTGTQVIINLQ